MPKSYTPWSGKVDPTRCPHPSPVMLDREYCAACGQVWAAAEKMRGFQKLKSQVASALTPR